MDHMTLEQLDRQLGDWLEDERTTRAPDRLVEDVFARTTRMPQARRWPAPWRRVADRATGLGRTRTWQLSSGLASVVATALLVVTISLLLRAGQTGPAATPPASPSPSAGIPGSSGSPVPIPTALGTVTATSLDLGAGSGPISPFAAFDSIWVSSLDGASVRRFDPRTMAEQASIDVAAPGWFAEADGALWVTRQGATGLARIDPETNTVVATVGTDAPCGAPVVAFGSIWQAACDAGVVMRIDPVRNVVADTIPAARYGMLVLAGGRLITFGPDGLAALDPTTRAFTTIGYPDARGARFIASDGETVWIMGTTDLARLDPVTGAVLASYPYVGARFIAFGDGTGWLTSAGDGVIAIDLATNQAGEIIPVPGAPNVLFDAGDTLWITDFSGDRLWKLDR